MSTFKIGDIVRVVRSASTASITHYNKVGKIIQLKTSDICGPYNDYPYKYCILDIDKHSGGIWLGELEMVM